MYRSVLVPLDGSAFAEQALPLALTIARRAGATISVVQVHVPFTPMYADSIAPGTYEADATVLEQQRAYLDGMVKRLTSVSSTSVTSPSWKARPLLKHRTARQQRQERASS